MHSLNSLFPAQWMAWLDANPIAYGIMTLAFGIILVLVLSYGFERVALKVVRRTNSDLDDTVLKSIRWPIKITVFSYFLYHSVTIFFRAAMIHSMTDKVMDTLVILLWVWATIKITRTVFSELIKRKRGDTTLVQMLPLLDNLATVIIWSVGAYLVLKKWEVNVTPLLASAGIVTAAVALASKDTLANFLGGLSVLVDRPYKLGDYVILSDGSRGEVVHIGIRSTRILTRDDVLITVPNSMMSNTTIINQSGHVHRYRLRAKVGVAYGSDIESVEKNLLAACDGVRQVLGYPSPRVRFRNFGDSSLDFELMWWIKNPADRGLVMHHVNKNIYNNFNQAGIEIPFPQRVVTMVPNGMEQQQTAVEPDEAEKEPEGD